MFIEELAKVFPKEKTNFKRFYNDLSNRYMNIIAENPAFISPDAMKKEYGLKFESKNKLLKNYIKNYKNLLFIINKHRQINIIKKLV